MTYQPPPQCYPKFLFFSLFLLFINIFFMISFFLIISLIFIYPNLPTYVYLPYLYLLTYLCLPTYVSPYNCRRPRSQPVQVLFFFIFLMLGHKILIPNFSEFDKSVIELKRKGLNDDNIDSLHHLQRFLLSVTAKDVSLLITFRQVNV